MQKHSLFWFQTEKVLIFTIIFILSTATLYSQKRVRDTMLLKVHSPTKATIMSAALPGLGQIYNRKYWKLPILYGGAATIGYFIAFNSKYYKDFRQAYKYRTDGNPSTVDKYTDVWNERSLLELRDYYRRNLELTYIIAGGLYILNILDAAVDANLWNYNISDDLTLNVKPYYFRSYDNNLNFALSFNIRF